VSCAPAVAAPCVEGWLGDGCDPPLSGVPALPAGGDPRRHRRRRPSTVGDRRGAVLAAAQCIVLATRSDLYGEVEIEVRVGADLDDQAGGQPLFDGELLTTGQGILVGNSLTELHHVGLPIGWHPIRIYAEPPSNPARFTVLLEVRPAGG
jgi:hypothetical protein